MKRRAKKDDGIGYTTGQTVAPAEESPLPTFPGQLAEEQVPALVAGPAPLAIVDDAPDSLSVFCRSPRGFVRCGRRFGIIPTVIKLADLTVEEIETIKSTPALCWSFLKQGR